MGDSRRLILFILIILAPLAFRLTTRALTLRGDTSPLRRAQVLEHFTDEDIARGRQYHAAYQPGGAVANVVFWAILAWLIFGGAARALADRAAELSQGRLVLELLIVAVPLFLLLRLALLPISYYHGFVLEGEFGFRRLELAPWLWRLIKGWTVTGAAQLVIGLGFFWLARHLGDRWVWPAIGGGAILALVYIVIWPLVILPLFYKVTPLPAGELREGVTEVAERAGVSVADVRFVDQSRVSGHTNAFFVGVGKRRSIYLYDTLAENHSTPEILSVVAHEIGHWRHRHMLKGWALGVIGLTVGAFLLRWLLNLPAVQAALQIRGAADLAIIPLLWALSSVAGAATAPVGNVVSRHFERQADQVSLELTADPETFIQMKTTMARKNRSNLLPHPFVVFWYSTHPPTIDRIAAAEAYRERRP